jgi:hypothetical protein
MEIYGAISQKRLIFLVTAMRTWNLGHLNIVHEPWSTFPEFKSIIIFILSILIFKQSECLTEIK